jgi:hypothetical protein
MYFDLQKPDLRPIWIDPPSGWKYGFPKLYKPKEDGLDLEQWLVKNGYPQGEIDAFEGEFWYRGEYAQAGDY